MADRKTAKIQPHRKKRKITCHGKPLVEWPFIRSITKAVIEQEQKAD